MARSHRLDKRWQTRTEPIQHKVKQMNINDHNYQRLYPDLIANGGVLNWATELMVQDSGVAVSGWGPNYAHIQHRERSAQVFVHLQERQFTFDLWSTGKVFANGEHSDFELVIQVIRDWVTTEKTAEQIEQQTGFVKARSSHPRSTAKPGAHLIVGDTLEKIDNGRKKED